MQPRMRMGLIVGVIGLALNVCVSGFIGLCGPLVSLIAGAVAGFFAAQQEKLGTKGEGARAGAIAGAVAGGAADHVGEAARGGVRRTASLPILEPRLAILG